MSKVIVILNGPNLNMLGFREPEIYGQTTLVEIEAGLKEQAIRLGFEVRSHQSNHEGVLIDLIQEAYHTKAAGVIINAGAYTHTSIAVHDALKILSCPIIEVHLSDPASREHFRHVSYIEPLAAEVIKGKGAAGYTLALDKLAEILVSQRPKV